MNLKSDIQRPRMLANVRRLPKRREAQASHSWDNPEAKPQSRATVRSRAAGLTLDGGECGGSLRPYLLMLWPSACVCSCAWLRADLPERIYGKTLLTPMSFGASSVHS
jgi:hypothetical protein